MWNQIFNPNDPMFQKKGTGAIASIKCDVCGERIPEGATVCHCLSEEALATTPCSLLWDETTVGEIVRWYARKCRRLALAGDFEGSKKIADESQGFDLIVQQFHKENIPAPSSPRD